MWTFHICAKSGARFDDACLELDRAAEGQIDIATFKTKLAAAGANANYLLNDAERGWLILFLLFFFSPTNF